MANSREAAVSLLDVNVLVALFDPEHTHYEAAHRWFEDNREFGWATCPLTENGLVRILSNFTYPGSRAPAAELRTRLERFCGSGHHYFWPDSLSLVGAAFDLAGVSHRHITD